MASIQKRRLDSKANGKDVYTWRVMWRDADGNQKSKTFTRERDARAFKADLESSQNRGTYVDPHLGRETFEAYAARWLETKHRTRRNGTYADYGNHLRNHILPTLGKRPLASVRRSDVQAWVNERASVLAPTTLRKVYGLVAAIFKLAVSDRIIGLTPCDQVELPRVKRERVEPFTPAQLRALVDAAAPRYRALIITAAGTGLRLGELLGLTVDRIDFHGGYVKVDRQSTDVVGGEPTFGDPKTERSNRVVPLPHVVLDALRAHLREFGSGPDGRHGCGPHGVVFTNTRNMPMRRQGFYAGAWHPTLRAVGLPTSTHFHYLRHTYASLLIAANESPKVIQERLGHATITETMDTYGHLYPSSEDSTRAAIDRALLPFAPVVASLLPGSVA
ncbi:tyrosine-type recombinase/integrase [Actinoplanes sp. URMC 104]|uniref:tyrosine-type recombinase/integrase n=1 Tax=Actinoplanes sp. URMC 104 TaxID=3423409 RepID=UPI003F1D7527